MTSIILLLFLYYHYSLVFPAVSWIKLVILFVSPRQSSSNMENEMTSYSMVGSLLTAICICSEVMNQAQTNLPLRQMNWSPRPLSSAAEVQLASV